MLPQLRQAGVVDAGGQGLLFIFEGFLTAIKGDSITLSDASLEAKLEAAIADAKAEVLEVIEGALDAMVEDFDAKLEAGALSAKADLEAAVADMTAKIAFIYDGEAVSGCRQETGPATSSNHAGRKPAPSATPSAATAAIPANTTKESPVGVEEPGSVVSGAGSVSTGGT